MTTNTLPTSALVSSTKTRKLTAYLPAIARSVLGAAFFVFGLNGFLNFIPPPTEPMPEGAVSLGMAFMSSGYLFQLIKGTEVLAGLLLLCNRFAPLALVVLAPVLVNIVAFHIFLMPPGIGLSLVLAGLELYLAWVYRAAFAPLLTARTQAR
jgi:uncharacterized membrane protein YphA (DoxX/SURF4 family)